MAKKPVPSLMASFSKGATIDTADLHLGRQQGDEDKGDTEYYCEVCQCPASGEISYKAHLEGARHIKNVKRVESGEDPVITSKGTKGENSLQRTSGPGILRCQPELDSSSDALLGLQYITEFTKSDPSVNAVYVCGICECKVDSGVAIMSHILGMKHRLAYLMEHYHHYYTAVKSSGLKGAALTSQVAESSMEAEKEEGRQKMKTRCEIDPFYEDMQIRIQAENKRKADEAAMAKKRGARGGGPGGRGGARGGGRGGMGGARGGMGGARGGGGGGGQRGRGGGSGFGRGGRGGGMGGAGMGGAGMGGAGMGGAGMGGAGMGGGFGGGFQDDYDDGGFGSGGGGFDQGFGGQGFGGGAGGGFGRGGGGGRGGGAGRGQPRKRKFSEHAPPHDQTIWDNTDESGGGYGGFGGANMTF